MTIKQLIDEIELVLGEVKDRLYEFTDTSRELKSKIRDKSPIIIEHIYKIQTYGNFSKYKKTRHHWASEIVGNMLAFSHKILKVTNKQVTTDFILKQIKDKYRNEDEMVDIIWNCCQEYKEIPITEINYKESYDNIIKVLPTLIDYIRNNRAPDLYEVVEIIEGGLKK